MSPIIIQLGIFFTLLAIGFIIGTVNEKLHYKSIRAREALYQSLPLMSFGKAPQASWNIDQSRLVMGSVVISVDYFKRFLAGLINIFGGHVTPYETLVDRARREAILRMKEDAQGMQAILNMRIETSSISSGSKKNSIGSIEVHAYGTAVTFHS